MSTILKPNSKPALYLAWPTRTVSIGVSTALLMFITFYATDVMKLNALQVGMVFVASKIFDGFTDIVAGFLIDKTNTKLGKARPYELALVGYWVFIVLLFSAPQMSAVAGLIYLFVMYTIVFSIFNTLLGCAEAPYLANALVDKRQSVSIAAVTGFIGLIFTVVANIALPLMVKEAGTDPAAWTKMALLLGIPFTLFGLIRFIFVREVQRETLGNHAQSTVKNLVRLLFHNKYILLVALMILSGNIGTNLNVNSYYFTYVMGDLSLAAPIATTMLTIVLALLVIPPLTKFFEMRRLLQVCTLIGLVGYLIRLIDVHNFPLLLISSFLSSLAFAAVYAFINPLIIDCMDYGEWKHGTRIEGMMAAAQSVAAKVGGAFGVGLVGILMGLSGYVGGQATQSDTALGTIIALNSVVPAFFALVNLILLQFYDLDKHIVDIRRTLAEKKA